MSDTTKAAEILGLVSNTIDAAQAGGKIVNRVTDALAEREIARRADLLVKGFDKLQALTKAFADINKPDGKVFLSNDKADNGQATYSEKRRGEIGKAQNSLDKFSAALEKAITKGDYVDLEKALKGGASDEAA